VYGWGAAHLVLAWRDAEERVFSDVTRRGIFYAIMRRGDRLREVFFYFASMCESFHRPFKFVASCLSQPAGFLELLGEAVRQRLRNPIRE